MAGPTAQGIHLRFLADADQREGICYTEYHGNGMRLVTIPVTKPPQGGSGSNTCYPFLRYGEFFLTKDVGAPQADPKLKDFIYANFTGYEDAGGSSSGNFKVRLIK